MMTRQPHKTDDEDDGAIEELQGIEERQPAREPATRSKEIAGEERLALKPLLPDYTAEAGDQMVQ